MKFSEVAPPGREKQVKKLKKKFDDPGAPYAIAWAQHNKHGKPKKKEALGESDDTTYVKMVIQKYPQEWKKFMQTGDLMDAPNIYEKLFVYFHFDTGEMPYGTAKARDGDPYEWIANKLDDLGLVEGKMSEIDLDIKTLSDAEFEKKYGKSKDQMQKDLNEDDVNEADLNAWYAEQYARELAEKDGKVWDKMSYGDKEDYRKIANKKYGVVKSEGEDVPTQKGRDAKPEILTKRAMNVVKKTIKKSANKQRRRMDKDSVSEDDYDDFSQLINPMGQDSTSLKKIKQSPGFHDLIVTMFSSGTQADLEQDEILHYISKMLNINTVEIKAILQKDGFDFAEPDAAERFKQNMGGTGFLGKGKTRTVNSKYEDQGDIKEDEGSLDQFRNLYKKSIGSDDAAVTLRELIQAINDDSLWSDQFPQLKQFTGVSPQSGSRIVTAKKIPGDSADEKIAALVQAIDDDEWVNDTAKHLMRSFTLGEDDNIEEAPFGKAVKSALGRVASRTATAVQNKLGSVPGMGNLKTVAKAKQGINNVSDQVWNDYLTFKQTKPDSEQVVAWFQKNHQINVSDIVDNPANTTGEVTRDQVEDKVKTTLAKQQSGTDKQQQPNQYQFKKGDEIKWTGEDGKEKTAKVVDPDKGPGGQQNMMTIQQGNRGTTALSKDKPFPADSEATQDDKVAIAQLQKIDPTANQTTLRAVNSVAGGKPISGQLQQFIQPIMKKISRALKDANKRQKLAIALSESLSQTDLSKLDMLAREGLVDKKNVSRFKTAMRMLAKGKDLPISYKDDVIEVVSKLSKIITKPSVMGMIRKGLKEQQVEQQAQEKFKTWVNQANDIIS
jgi:hypothetical protein